MQYVVYTVCVLWYRDYQMIMIYFYIWICWKNMTYIITYLSFSVNSNDTSSRLMGCSNKNGLPTYPVHVDTSSSLQVIEVDVAIFSNEKDYILLGTDLDKPREKLVTNSEQNMISKTQGKWLYCQIPIWCHISRWRWDHPSIHHLVTAA